MQILRTSRVLTVLLALIVLVAACGDDTDSDVGDDTDADVGDDTDSDADDESDDGDTRPGLAGGWVLVALTADNVTALPDGPIEMEIEAGRIGGSAGCNSFGGMLVAADDGTLTLTDLAWTEMGCMEPGLMEFESAYLTVLSSVNRWEVIPEHLVFSGPAGEIRYAPAPPPTHEPLMGTVWEFDTIFEGTGPDRAATHRADMEGVTLVVGLNESRLEGPGCEGTVISTEFDGDREGRWVTGRGGDLPDRPDCGVVAEALAGLVAAGGFMIDENRLTFIGEPGETVGFVAESR